MAGFAIPKKSIEKSKKYILKNIVKYKGNF